MSDSATTSDSQLRRHPTPETLAVAIGRAQALLQRCAPEHSDRAIHKALEVFGQAMQADRAYLFQMPDELSLRNTHEWCAPGIPAMKDELQQVPHNVGNTFWAAFRESGSLLLPEVELIPVGSELRQSLDQQGIKSLITTGLWADGDIIGFVGLDFVRSYREFSAAEDSLLRALAASIGLLLRLERSQGTEHRLQAELHTERARISALVSALPELLVETDADGTIIGFNQSDPLVFALNPDEVVGQPPEAVLPAPTARIVRKAMKEADQYGWSQSFSYSLGPPGTEKRYSLTATRRQQIGNHQRHGYMFVVRDITESYRQDQQNRQLVRVAELSTNLIMLTDADKQVIWMNPAAVARTGTSTQDAAGQRPSELLNCADSDPAAIAAIEADLAKGFSINRELRARSKHGTDFWLDLNMQPLRNPEGDVQGYMVVGVDITAHKLAEARALRDKAAAMEASQEGLAIMTADGQFSYLNKAMRGFFQLPADTPITDLRWQQAIPPRYADILNRILGELTVAGYWSGEFIIADNNGNDIIHEMSMSVQDDGSIFVIARDITARRLAQAERAALRAQLQIAQSRQLMSQLAGGLAHDFANILSVISGSVDMLEERLGTKGAAALARIRAASTQGQALARNLLALGAPRQERVPIALQGVFRHAVELIRPGIASEIALTVEMPEQDIIVSADNTELMQVLINLLMNAAEAIGRCDQPSDHDRRCEIRLRLGLHLPTHDPPTVQVGQIMPDTSYAMIEISDTGPGIPKQYRDKIFKPYFSTRHDHGTGLGLAIVAHLLQAHHGALELADTPGGGTTIRVFWPLQEPTRPAPPAPKRMIQPRPLNGRQILLVDDDDSILQTLSGYLADAGAEVASCTEPQDAIDALRDAPDAWDTVITDHDMSSMSGVEMAAELRRIRADLRLVLISGAPELQFANESDKTLFDVCLSKPVSGTTLIARLLQP
ncbi:MAG: PAS domain-containing protein [Rhodobacteraceae bacterium]|nr:PAS domain-containing protein [Paracoccaceae bacterium]